MSPTHKSVTSTVSSEPNPADWAHEQDEFTLAFRTETFPLLPSSASTRQSFASVVMEKVKSSKFAYWADKIAVESEPGLTNAQVKLSPRICADDTDVGSDLQLFLANFDLKPVEPARRQWRSRNFVAFWIADSFNINTWMIASASMLDGLSWWQAWVCVWVGYFIAGCFICSTGRIGATYHLAFPVINRASFGIWGSLWPVLNRAVMACIWYGVQSWIGGTVSCYSTSPHAR